MRAQILERSASACSPHHLRRARNTKQKGTPNTPMTGHEPRPQLRHKSVQQVWQEKIRMSMTSKIVCIEGQVARLLSEIIAFRRAALTIPLPVIKRVKRNS